MADPNKPREDAPERSEFVDALRKGALIGLAVLVVAVPPLRMWKNKREQAQQPPVATAPAPGAAPGAGAPQAPRGPAGALLADFRGEEASAEARHVANWAVYTKDHQQRAFVIVDKVDARVYVFGPDGRLRDSAPALMGSARGDDTFPGVGDKPLDQVRPEEKTTPAGRFIAEPGRNANGEDIVWVDYAAAVSMHRVRPLVAAERRLERLATPAIDDNRISFGCINLPVAFYEDVLSPTVRKYGAVVYVLPEVKTAQQVFGSFDVPPLQQVALHRR